MITLVILICLSLVLFLWQISNFISIFSGSVYVKSKRDVINFALKKSGLKRRDIFYDLGCGNGDVVLQAQKYGARCTGIEISPFYYLLSSFRIFVLKAYHKNRSSSFSGMNIRFGDIKKVDLKNVDVVYCYLLPKFLKKLTPKFLRERPKTIISIGFAIDGLPKPRLYRYKNHKVFIYSLTSRSA